MSEFKDIIYEKQWMDYVARVTINRPHAYNAYTTNTLQELSKALEDAMWDDSVRIIVLTGAGDKAFCTGGDVREYAEWLSRKPSDFYKYGTERFGRVAHLIMRCGKIVIARVNGVCAGGGNELHAACDLSIAAEHARFLQPGPRVGMASVGGATQWLPLIIGHRRAAWLCLTTREVDAKTAYEWGLVNQVVPYEKLDEAVADLCNELLNKMPTALRNVKTHLNIWKGFIWSITEPHASEWFAYHGGDDEPLEGLWAFVEKRRPDYAGIHRRIKEGSADFLWGPPVRVCPKCGTKRLPSFFKYCGVCGAALD
jgi:enoyl-CoA hydratase/carnithine racemase